MKSKRYDFESWVKNERVNFDHLDVAHPVSKPIHTVLFNNSWRAELLSDGHIEQKEIDLIRQRQKEVFDFYLDRRLKKMHSDIKESFEKAKRPIEFGEDVLTVIHGKVESFRKTYPKISSLYHQGVDISYLVDPDLFMVFDTAMSQNTKLHPITSYAVEEELMSYEDLDYISGVKEARSKLELYCNFCILNKQISYFQSLIDEAERRRKDKRGRSDTRISMPEEFFKRAKKLRTELGQDALSRKNPKNPSGMLISELSGSEGHLAENPGKKVPTSDSTIKRILIANRDKWL